MIITPTRSQRYTPGQIGGKDFLGVGVLFLLFIPQVGLLQFF